MGPKIKKLKTIEEISNIKSGQLKQNELNKQNGQIVLIKY